MAEAISSPSTDILPIIGKWTAPPNSLQASLLLAFMSSAGLYYVNIFPAITNALMEGAGLSTVDAGQITSANALGAACGALAVTLFSDTQMIYLVANCITGVAWAFSPRKWVWPAAPWLPVMCCRPMAATPCLLWSQSG